MSLRETPAEVWDLDELNQACVDILSALPRPFVGAKTELTTRLLQMLRPADAVEERVLLRSLTAALRNGTLPDVRVIPWRHPAGLESHAVVLDKVYLADSNALSVIDTQMTVLRSLESWVVRGKLAERAVEGSLRDAGLSVETYRSTGVREAGRLDRAVDLAVTSGGRVVVGIEVKNLRTETLHHLEPAYRSLARQHRAMGADYLVAAPAVSHSFRDALEACGGTVLETGCYLVDTVEQQQTLLALGTPFPVEVTVGQAGTGERLPAWVEEAVVGPVARLVARHETPRHSVGVRHRPTIADNELRTALDRHATGRCMGCGTRLWVSGTCVMRRCGMHGETQDYKEPRQSQLARAAGISDRALRDLVKRMGIAAPWKGRGRPRKTGSRRFDRPYGAMTGWSDELMARMSEGGSVTEISESQTSNHPVTQPGLSSDEGLT